jgi:hypothetical protein
VSLTNSKKDLLTERRFKMKTVTNKEFSKFIESLDLDFLTVTQTMTDSNRVITFRLGRKILARNVMYKNIYGDWVNFPKITTGGTK